MVRFTLILIECFLISRTSQENPRILRKNVKRYLEPLSAFLKSLYGDELFLEAVKRNPKLLLVRGLGCDAPEDSIVSIEDFLVSSLGFKRKDLTFLKEKAPWIFQRSLEHVQAHVAFWNNILQNSGKSESSKQGIISMLLKSYPTLFNCSLQKGLVPKVKFLQGRCGLSKEDVASLLIGHRAAVFCLSVEDNLRPSVKFLSEHLLTGADDERTVNNIRKCIVTHPNILCMSKEKMLERISYFDKIDSMCVTKPESSLASRIALRAPTVFSLSLDDNIIPKINFLAGVWGAEAPITSPEVRRPFGQEESKGKAWKRSKATPCLTSLLAESPSILTMSLEGNLQPTLKFYNRTGYIHLDEDWKLQTSESASGTVTTVRARYIASSLFQRLLPRWHFFLLKTNDEDVILSNELKRPPLHILAAAADGSFCDHLGVKELHFKQFKDEQVPRLKFSSQFDTWLRTGRPIE